MMVSEPIRERAIIYRGHVKNGVVVLDDVVTLPEGLSVNVECVAGETVPAARHEGGETLGQKLLKHVGKATGLPADAARNHDHYLYGTPKK